MVSLRTQTSSKCTDLELEVENGGHVLVGCVWAARERLVQRKRRSRIETRSGYSHKRSIAQQAPAVALIISDNWLEIRLRFFSIDVLVIYSIWTPIGFSRVRRMASYRILARGRPDVRPAHVLLQPQTGRCPGSCVVAITICELRADDPHRRESSRCPAGAHGE